MRYNSRRPMGQIVSNKILILASIVFLLGNSSLRGQEYGRIYSITSKSDTVDMGACLIGDSLETRFVLEKTGGPDLRINETGSVLTKSHLAYIGLPPWDEQHFEFEEIFEAGLLTGGKSSDTVTIKYIATANLARFPFGLKQVDIEFALYDAAGTTVLLRDTFLLYARKAEHYIAKYDDTLSFDSVYVGAELFAERSLRLKNVWAQNQKIVSHSAALVSSKVTDDEFFFQNFPDTLILTPDDSIQWGVNYKPLDLRPDTAMMSYSFQPFPAAEPDSIVYDTAMVLGYGVVQRLSLIYSDYDFSIGDSVIINIGNLMVGQAASVRGKLQNRGNIPFGALSQSIIDLGPGQRARADLAGIPDTLHLPPEIIEPEKSIAEFTLDVEPLRQGPFMLKYVIESDIFDRHIFGASQRERYVEIFIKGNGLAPSMLVQSDTLDFGKVVSDKCFEDRQLDFIISNTGNYDLIIYSIRPARAAPFEAYPNEMSVPPGADSVIAITFDPTDEVQYSDSLIILTNQPKGNDTTVVYLRGEGVPRSSTILEIPGGLAAKPGSSITIPIKIDSSRISIVRRFEASINYDRTILFFDQYKTVGSAVEGLGDESYVTENANGLDILLVRGGNQPFLERGDLIYLIFDVYLGYQPETDVIFVNPKLGDGICESVLDIDLGHGLFKLDSVCGLSYKAFNRGNSSFGINSISPFPAQEFITISYETGIKSDVHFSIYNSYGILVKSITEKNIGKGSSEAIINISDLPSGVYYCEMAAGIFRQAVPIIISR